MNKDDVVSEKRRGGKGPVGIEKFYKIYIIQNHKRLTATLKTSKKSTKGRIKEQETFKKGTKNRKKRNCLSAFGDKLEELQIWMQRTYLKGEI